METKRKSTDETKSFTMKTTSEKEEGPAKGINFFREESRKESNGTLKRTTASKSYSKEFNDKKGNKSVRERKEGAKINSVDQLDKRSIRGELSSNGSKCDAKGKAKPGEMTVTDGRRQRRPLRDIIGKREQRRDELEKAEGDLRQRLDMLECSIPAVMVWNVWRMAQGAPCRIKRILEKQFEDTKELSCRTTPSRHYDCRVREVEADRKLALRKVEEARNLWSEKLATLEERKRKLEEARRIQEEQKCTLEHLNEEARILQEMAEKPEMDESCRYGECGDTQCKQSWLDKVTSVTSITSGDIQCLEKLQRLAEEEMTMKRDIVELERREEAYMRTLQQADELWSKMEGDTLSVTSTLQEQLDMKTAANQQLADRVCELEDALEKCRTRMAACRAELEKFLSIEKVEATIGREDDVAEVTDKEVIAKVKVVHRPIGKVDDVATVEDAEVLAKVKVADEETLTKVEVADEEALARIALIDAVVEAAFIGDDKYVSAIPDVVDIAIDRPVDLVRVEDAEGVVQPEDFAYEEQRFKEVRAYLAELDSLEDLYKDDGEPCAPDFVCNDVVSSPTGMTDEELTALEIEPTALTTEFDRKLIVSEIKKREADIMVQRDTILSWVDAIDTIRERAAKHPDCHAVKKDADILVKEISAYVGLKPKEIQEEHITTITTEEISVEEKSPIELVAEPKLLPKLTGEEVATDIEPSTVISIADSFQLPTIPIEEDLKGNAIPQLSEPVPNKVEIEKRELEEPIQVEKIVQKTKEVETDTVKEDTRIKDLTDKDKVLIKKIETDKVSPIPTEINEHNFQIPTVLEKLEEIPQLDQIRMADVNETVPHVEIVETKEVAEIAPAAEMKEIKGEEAIPIVVEEKIKEITEPEKVSPTVDLIEEKKLELPMMAVEDVSIADAVEETIKVEKLPLSLDTEEIEESLIQDAETEEVKIEEPVQVTDIIQEKVELPIKIKEKAIADEEPSPIIDMIKEEEPVQPVIEPSIEIKEKEELPVVEKLPEIELLKVEVPPADIIKEEIEAVQPVIQPSAIIEKEAELPTVKEFPEVKLLKTELTDVQEVHVEREEEEEEEEEEIPSVKKEEILEAAEVAEIALPAVSAVEDEKEKEPVVEKKPEAIDEVRVQEKVPISETKPSEPKMLAIPIDPRLVTAQPYFVLAKITEKELLHIIPAMGHACIECCSRPPAETTKQVEITRTEVVQTELVQITTQTVTATEPPRTPPVGIIREYLKSAELKAPNAEIAGDRPEITGRKMLERKRLKDQSTVTTAGTGSQTDKTSHVSHKRAVRDERERARVPTNELLRSIKIAAGLPRPDTEHEIRTINYGGKSDETSKTVCNCCLCGKTPSPLSIRPKLEIQSQIGAKTATPAATAAAFKRIFIPPKIDRPVPYNRLCPDCKVRIQAKMSHQRYHTEKIIKKISRNQESCGCSTKSCRAAQTKPAEKKDQSLTKVPKQKSNGIDQKLKDNLQTILVDPKSLSIEPLSPSCICCELEKSDVEPIRKGNCYCADLTDT